MAEFNISGEIISDINVQHIEEVTTIDCCDSASSTNKVVTNSNDGKSQSMKNKKNSRQNIDEGNAGCISSNQASCNFSSPPSARLRSRKRQRDVINDKSVADKKKNRH